MQRRVVCIEDDSEIIDLISLIVERQGMEFIGAQGGMSGLETVKRLIPDLVLLDLMMPDVDGWQVYDTLRSSPETRQIPIIIVTARGQQDHRVMEMRASNAENLVTKPFGPADLIRAMERVLAQSAP